jgi:hypothetical protein
MQGPDGGVLRSTLRSVHDLDRMETRFCPTAAPGIEAGYRPALQTVFVCPST